MPLLDEIIGGAVDDEMPLSVLLRKCLLLAYELKNEKLKAWTENELNGYADADALPDYRKIKVTAVGTFAGPFGNLVNNQPLAASVLPEDFRHWAESAVLMQPVVAYDVGRDAEGRPNNGKFQWPADLVALFADKFLQGWNLVRAHQVIPGSVFVSLLDTVRTRILQLALELKKETGDRAKELSEIPPRRIDQSVVTNIFGGNIVIAGHAENFAQIGAISIQEGNFDQLRNALKEIGVEAAAIDNLRKALREDAKADEAKPTLGQRTMGWLKDSASYASKEGLKVGIEIAKKFATKWVLQHLGIDPT